MRRSRRSQHGTPVALVPPALIGALFLLVPVIALLIRAPWSGLRGIYAGDEVGDALVLSLKTATVATVLSVIFGVPLAWMLARLRFPGRSLLRAAVTLPLVLPPVVGGVALLFALGRRGVIGQYLDRWFGVQLAYTTSAVILAETFVAMPFLVISAEGAFRSADRGVEEAAATLGASRLRIFATVTVPTVAPALVAGAVLCWARALGEFGATIIFAGAYPGRTETMPTLISVAINESPEEAAALSLVLMLVALVVLGALRDRWLRAAGST